MIKCIPSLLLSLTLAACGATAAYAPKHSQSATPNYGRNFGDSHPITAWGGRPPQSYPVHGIDVARYQTAIDWQKAQAAGVKFAFIKATEGGDMVDPMFRQHVSGAARAGVPVGAYHFFYHCRPAHEQAQWFIANVPKTKNMLPPVLDMEWTPDSPTCTIRRAPEVLRAEAEVFIKALTRHYGQRPILYTAIDFFETNQMWRVKGADFWLRAVAKHPQDLYAGQHWAFWQYTSTGLVPGVNEAVDINVFEGSLEQWQNWLKARRH